MKPTWLLLAALIMAPCCAESQTLPSAIDLLRKRAEGAPRLEGSGAGGAVALSLLNVGVAAGGVAWALAPHYQHWGNEHESYGGTGTPAGLVQSLAQISVVLVPVLGESRRARSELTGVLDEADPAARESLAAAALRRLDRRRGNAVAGGVLAYVALSALSAIAYNVGEEAIGRNPYVEDTGYVESLAFGTGIMTLLLFKASLESPSYPPDSGTPKVKE